MTAFDSLELRRTLGRFATGICVAATIDADDQPVGMTINSFGSLSLEPPLILWSIGNGSSLRAAFEQHGYFSINVLRVDQVALSNTFAMSPGERFAGLDWTSGIGGVPLLAGCIAHFQCALERVLPGGDHQLILGRVVALEQFEGDPLLFYAGGYRRIGDSAGGW